MIILRTVLKHRSVGGYRASMYNAMSIDSVKVLVEVMSELESKI